MKFLFLRYPRLDYVWDNILVSLFCSSLGNPALMGSRAVINWSSTICSNLQACESSNYADSLPNHNSVWLLLSLILHFLQNLPSPHLPASSRVFNLLLFYLNQVCLLNLTIGFVNYCQLLSIIIRYPTKI